MFDDREINASQSVLSCPERLYGLTFEASPLVMAVVEADGTVAAWNTSAEKVLGVKRVKIVGESIFEFPLPCDMRTISSALRACIDFGESVSLDHVRFQHSDNSQGVLRMILQPIVDDDKCVGVLLQAIDETVRYSLEARLLRENPFTTIGKLAPGIAHEINNPVSFVGNNIGTLKQYVADMKLILSQSKELAETCAGMDDNAGNIAAQFESDWHSLKIDAMLQDVDGLLDETLEGTTRMQAIALGLKEFSKTSHSSAKTVNMNDCLDHTISFAWNEIKYKTRLNKKYGELPELLCLPDHIRQLFLNLLLKIVEPIEKYGEISVSTCLSEDKIIVEFSDGATAIMRGSSVTGKSFRTGRAFNAASDLDLAISSSALLNRAKSAGIKLRSAGRRTGPLNTQSLEKLGLAGLQENLKRMTGREVSFMFYDSVESIAKRGPHMYIPR